MFRQLSVSDNNAKRRNCSDRHVEFDVLSLEQRRMMAGDVGVSVINGDLVVRGDRDDNAIEITQVNGEFQISGFDGTTINGASHGSNNPLTVSGVSDDVRIYLKAGDDQINFHDASVANDARIILAGGNDKVTIQNITVADDMDIATGGGNDSVLVVGADVEDQLKIRSTANRDDVTVLAAATTSRTSTDPSDLLANIPLDSLDQQTTDRLQSIREKQEEIAEARQLLQQMVQLKQDAGNGTSEMTAEMETWLNERSISFDATGNDHLHTRSQWDTNIEQLNAYIKNQNSDVELEMLTVQSDMAKRNQALQMASNNMQTNSDLKQMTA